MICWHKLTRTAVSGCLLGAVWSTVSASRCVGCGLLGSAGVRFGEIGIVFYGLLLLYLFTSESDKYLRITTFGASGVHIALVDLMLKTGNLCPSCLFTSLCSLFASVCVYLGTKSRSAVSLGILPLSAVLTVAGLQSMGATAAQEESLAIAAF
jgi:hypothetical protein